MAPVKRITLHLVLICVNVYVLFLLNKSYYDELSLNNI